VTGASDSKTMKIASTWHFVAMSPRRAVAGCRVKPGMTGRVFWRHLIKKGRAAFRDPAFS
jgi:hypothetical protein